MQQPRRHPLGVEELVGNVEFEHACVSRILAVRIVDALDRALKPQFIHVMPFACSRSAFYRAAWRPRARLYNARPLARSRILSRTGAEPAPSSHAGKEPRKWPRD